MSVAARPAPADLLGPIAEDLTVAFHAGVAEYRREFWSRLALPAVQAYRVANDMAGFRWFKMMPGSKAATLAILRAAYPDVTPVDDGKALFIRAVRESALGCIR